MVTHTASNLPSSSHWRSASLFILLIDMPSAARTATPPGGTSNVVEGGGEGRTQKKSLSSWLHVQHQIAEVLTPEPHTGSEFGVPSSEESLASEVEMTRSAHSRS